MADALNTLSDRLAVKFGPHWPMVLCRRGFCTALEARRLRRALMCSSGGRRTQTHCLNRVLAMCRRVGIDTKLTISIDSL